MAASIKYLVSPKTLEIFEFTLLNPFIALLKDSDLEVKKQAFISLTKVCNQF